MLSVRLPEDIEARLGWLAKSTHRTKSFYAKEALMAYIDDLEDVFLASIRLEEIKKGKSKLYTIDEVEKNLALED